MTEVYISNGSIFINGKATLKCTTAIQLSSTAMALNSLENSTKRRPRLKK